jgi:hypothetical protein
MQIRTVQRSPGVPRPGLRRCVLPVVPAHDQIEGWRSGRSWAAVGWDLPGLGGLAGHRGGRDHGSERVLQFHHAARAGPGGGMLARLRWPGGGASSDTGAVSAGWLVRTDHRAIGPKQTRSPLRALMTVPPVDPGTSGTAALLRLRLKRSFGRTACSGTWPAGKPWDAARPSGNAGPVSSGYDRWEHAGAIRSRSPCPAVRGGVDQSPNTRNSMTK